MAGRAKGLEKFDRNGVVQHRNYVCEIALKKTISTFQKEGKILEKELREIAKVRETLRQIRAPLRRKVFEASIEDQSESEEVLNNGKPLRRRKLGSGAMANARGGASALGQTTERKQSRAADKTPDASRSKTSMSCSSRRFSQTVPPRRPKQSVSYLQPPSRSAFTDGETSRRRKISAPAHFGSRSPNTSSPNEGFLPPISPTVPGNSPKAFQPSAEVLSTCGSEEDTSRLVSASRAETASRYAPLTAIPRGRGIVDPEEDKSLTMEETLRIKGKFRQIGHSIIATALLKGLRQKGQLTSEAIHNMHKPVSVNNTQKEEEEEEEVKAESSADESEDEDSKKKTPVNPSVSKFRAAARKTINVNRLINNRTRSQSDPVQSATKGDSRKKSLADESGKVDGMVRKNSEERSDACEAEHDDEKQVAGGPVGNPLMNSHIARRRKFGVATQAVIAGSFFARVRSAASTADAGWEQAHDSEGDVRVARASTTLPAGHVGIGERPVQRAGEELESHDARETGADSPAKTVRFKLDAWEWRNSSGCRRLGLSDKGYRGEWGNFSPSPPPPLASETWTISSMWFWNKHTGVPPILLILAITAHDTALLE